MNSEINGPSQRWLGARLEQPSLKRYAQAVRARLGLVCAFVVVATGAALAYTQITPKHYQAEADLLVTPVSPDNTALVGLPLIRNTSDPTSDVLTVSKLVSSPAVAQLVAGQLGGNLNALLGDIQATPVTQSSIIAIQATAGSPARAAAIANGFAHQTINLRTAALHAQLATQIPSLRASMAGLSASERGALSSQLAILETLRVAPDPTVTISSTARVPTSPSSPSRKLSIAAGAFAGLVLALLVVFGLQALDPRLRDEDELRGLYRIPLLAKIPRQRSTKTPLAPRELTPATEEAFRSLRTAYTVRDGETNRGRAILLTGDNAGNGKTTVALNLAAMLAAAGRQVILIEADLRRPSIGRALGVRASRGVSEVLLGDSELVDALIWARPYGPLLELLLARPGAADALDRVSSSCAAELVGVACELAEFVIIDCPPLADVSEALIFADAADDVLVVARIGRSQMRRLTDLGELLERRGITPAGLVLVGAEHSGSSYYYTDRDRGSTRTPVLWGLLQRRVETTGAPEHNGSGMIAG
jgi:Mrp family chromosome partitioning ATPase/capsular polysaccharide biosynthesis protein